MKRSYLFTALTLASLFGSASAMAQFQDNAGNDYGQYDGGRYDTDGRYRRNYDPQYNLQNGRPAGGVDSDINCEEYRGRSRCTVSVEFGGYEIHGIPGQGKTIITAGEAIDAAQLDWNDDDIARGAKLVDVAVGLDVISGATIAYEYGAYAPLYQGQRPAAGGRGPDGRIWGKFAAPGRDVSSPGAPYGDVPSGYVTMTRPGQVTVKMGDREYGRRGNYIYTNASIQDLGIQYRPRRGDQTALDADYLNINLTPGARVQYVDFVFEGPSGWRMYHRGHRPGGGIEDGSGHQYPGNGGYPAPVATRSSATVRFDVDANETFRLFPDGHIESVFTTTYTINKYPARLDSYTNKNVQVRVLSQRYKARMLNPNYLPDGSIDMQFLDDKGGPGTFVVEISWEDTRGRRR